MFFGSMVALVTPMNEAGELDFEALERLIEFHVENNTNAIVAVGTTGESATLNHKEHCSVIKFVVDKVRQRIPVIAGTGANSTSEAVELTLCASQVGVDACLLVTPYYNKPTQEGLFLHHQMIASKVSIPQILYNVPGRTACDMLPDTVCRLAEIPNIIGIKEATANLDRMRTIYNRCGEQLALFSGDDATSLDFILAGGKGTISVTSNIVPDKMSRLCQAAIDGDAATARKINQKLDALHQNLFLEANPIPVKWALYEMGLIAKGIRLPMTQLAEEYRQPLREAMKEAGVQAKV